jgi:hypothetical protein
MESLERPINQEPPEPPAIPCPWCAFAAKVLAQVIAHMAARHATRWQDLACYPPIAGSVA